MTRHVGRMEGRKLVWDAITSLRAATLDLIHKRHLPPPPHPVALQSFRTMAVSLQEVP
jgi:hypothetical protein